MRVMHRALQLEAEGGTYRSLGELERAFVRLRPEWALHGRRVAVLLESALGRLRRLSLRQGRALLLAARLHDVGYLGLPGSPPKVRLDAERMGVLRARLLRIRAYWMEQDPGQIEAHLQELGRLWVLVNRINLGGGVGESDRRELERYAERCVSVSGQAVAYLDFGELQALLSGSGVCYEEAAPPWRAHVSEGVRLLEAIEEVPSEACQYVAWHHERLDGSGFPAGIRELPLPAQLLVAADMFDSYTSGSLDPARQVEALRMLEHMVRAGRLESVVLEHLMAALQAPPAVF